MDSEGPAGMGGVLPGDWLLAVNGEGVNGMDELYRFMGKHPPGETLVSTRSATSTTTFTHHFTTRV